MNHKSVFRGIRASFSQHQHPWIWRALSAGIAGSLLVGAAPGSAHAETSDECETRYEHGSTYPALPEASAEADVSGEAGVLIYLEADRAIVELDGCLYRADRSLVVDFDGLDFITLLVELPASSSPSEVYVHDDTGAQLHTSSGSTLTYVWEPTHELGFELAAPGQAAPTGPVVVARPTTGNPEPE